jgi:hypothetical protein
MAWRGVPFLSEKREIIFEKDPFEVQDLDTCFVYRESNA